MLYWFVLFVFDDVFGCLYDDVFVCVVFGAFGMFGDLVEFLGVQPSLPVIVVFGEVGE